MILLSGNSNQLLANHISNHAGISLTDMKLTRFADNEIFCEINPSEDPEKVKSAVNNIFPDIELDVSDSDLSGETSDIQILSQISKSIHEKNTKTLTNEFLKKTMMAILLGFISTNRQHLSIL